MIFTHMVSRLICVFSCQHVEEKSDELVHTFLQLLVQRVRDFVVPKCPSLKYIFTLFSTTTKFGFLVSQSANHLPPTIVICYYPLSSLSTPSTNILQFMQLIVERIQEDNHGVAYELCYFIINSFLLYMYLFNNLIAHFSIMFFFLMFYKYKQIY